MHERSSIGLAALRHHGPSGTSDRRRQRGCWHSKFRDGGPGHWKYGSDRNQCDWIREYFTELHHGHHGKHHEFDDGANWHEHDHSGGSDYGPERDLDHYSAEHDYA